MDVVGGGTVPVPEARETLQNERARRGQRTISLSLSLSLILHNKRALWKANVVSAKGNKKEAVLKR